MREERLKCGGPQIKAAVPTPWTGQCNPLGVFVVPETVKYMDPFWFPPFCDRLYYTYLMILHFIPLPFRARGGLRIDL
jgi:hypothetical protein